MPVLLCLLPHPSVTFAPQLHQSAGDSEHRGFVGNMDNCLEGPAQLARDAFLVLPLTRGEMHGQEEITLS